MAEVPDLELLKTADERLPLGGGGGRAGLWLALAVGIAAAAVAGYIIYGRRHAPDSATDTRKPVQVRQQPVGPLGGEGDAIVLPPLAESDAVVRELVAKLSSHPAVAAWLTTDGLIRNFTVVVAASAVVLVAAAAVVAFTEQPSWVRIASVGWLVLAAAGLLELRVAREEFLAEALVTRSVLGSVTRLYSDIEDVQLADGQLHVKLRGSPWHHLPAWLSGAEAQSARAHLAKRIG